MERLKRWSPSSYDGDQIVRHLLFTLACAVGGTAAAIGLALLTNGAFLLLRIYPWLLYLLPVFSLLTCGLYRLLRLYPFTSARDFSAILQADRPVPIRIAVGMTLGTALSILGGASVDRTGAVFSLGATLGDGFGRLFRLQPIRERKHSSEFDDDQSLLDETIETVLLLLDDDPETVKKKAEKVSDRKDPKPHSYPGLHNYSIACGMVATFAALFFAPLTAVVLVLELGSFNRHIRHHILSITLAAFVAGALSSCFHIGNVLPLPDTLIISWHWVALAVLIGVACGLMGKLFVGVIKGIHKATRRVNAPIELWVIIGSLLTVILITLFGWESFEGTGLSMVAHAMAGAGGPFDFLIKALLTVLALGFWLKGGEVMPTLVIGSLLGYSCTLLVEGDSSLAAVLGMIAMFSSVLRCPLAAVLLGCEVFGWAGFPLYLITVIITNIIGRDVGLYGQGTISAFRHIWEERKKRHVSR